MADTVIIVGGSTSNPAGSVITSVDTGRTELAGTHILTLPSAATATGTFTPTEATDTMSCSGVITHAFTMALTEHTDIWNDLSPADGSPDSDITGWLGFFGPFNVTEINDTFSGAGPGTPPGLFASWDGIEVNDFFDGAGIVPVIATMGGAIGSSVESPDIFHGIVQHPKQFTLALIEAKDVFHATAFTTGVSGLLATTEPVDRFHGVVFIQPQGPLTATELADRFAARAPGVVTIIRRLISVN